VSSRPGRLFFLPGRLLPIALFSARSCKLCPSLSTPSDTPPFFFFFPASLSREFFLQRQTRTHFFFSPHRIVSAFLGGGDLFILPPLFLAPLLLLSPVTPFSDRGANSFLLVNERKQSDPPPSIRADPPLSPSLPPSFSSPIRPFRKKPHPSWGFTRPRPCLCALHSRIRSMKFFFLCDSVFSPSLPLSLQTYGSFLSKDAHFSRLSGHIPL